MLLEKAGISFTQTPVAFDEDQIIASSPKNFVYQATLGKFEDAIKQYGYDELKLVCLVNICVKIIIAKSMVVFFYLT